MTPHSPLPRYARVALHLLAAWAVGCAEGPAEPVVFEDARIDGGEAWSVDPRSLDPRLCVSGDYAYAAWWDDREGPDDVWLAVSRDRGDNWSSLPIRVNQNPDNRWNARHPEIACHEQEIYVVWEDDRASDIENPAIYYNFSQDAGETWRDDDVAVTANDGDWASLSPRLALSCTGDDPAVCSRLSVAWYDGRDGAYDIYFNRSANYGFNWMQEGEVRVDTDGQDAHSGKPRLAVDGHGGVFLAWEDRRGGTTDVYFNRSTDWGTTWGEEDVRLDLDDGSAPADSFVNDVAVEAGRVFVVWSDRRGGEGQDVYVARSPDSGATFDPPVRLDVGDGPGISDSLYPVVRAAGDEVLVAWRDDRAGAFDILLQRSEDGGASWLDEPLTVEAHPRGTAHSLDPALMLDGEGRVAVAWSDLRNGYEDVYFNVSADGGRTFGAEDLRVDADEPGTAISASLQAAMEGGALYFLWLDWRYGEADVLFRRMEPEFSPPPP